MNYKQKQSIGAIALLYLFINIIMVFVNLKIATTMMFIFFSSMLLYMIYNISKED